MSLPLLFFPLLRTFGTPLVSQHHTIRTLGFNPPWLGLEPTKVTPTWNKQESNTARPLLTLQCFPLIQVPSGKKSVHGAIYPVICFFCPNRILSLKWAFSLSYIFPECPDVCVCVFVKLCTEPNGRSPFRTKPEGFVKRADRPARPPQTVSRD